MADIPTAAQTAAKAPVNVDLMQGLRENLGATIGTILPFHTYDSLISIPTFFMICDGGVISEANYNSLHGAGKWTEDVGTTVLDGKYTPDFTDRYAVGTADTTEDGTGAIATTGNSSHQTDIGHNHQWFNRTGTTSTSYIYDSGGSQTAVTSEAIGIGGASVAAVVGAGTGITGLAKDGYTASGGSATQDVQPDSIEVIYIIKVV